MSNMSKKTSEKVKTITVKNRQKNGDIYVLERKVVYLPEKKYNKVLSTKLISKIPKNGESAIPTRAKGSKKSKSTELMDNSSKLVATRNHIGMMAIIDHIGKVSGIDNALYDNTDIGTAQKIISLARYLLVTNGQSLPGITTWQYNHPLPYEEGISESIYHQLFVDLGRDENLQQNFFKARCKYLDDNGGIAYDSSTISTYSENQIEARYGFNKAGDGLKTIKYLSLYSIDNRQPIAFTKQPGNLPDIITIDNALEQLLALGIKKAEIITDNGYYSEQNISDLFQAHFNFITLAKTNLKWIREEIDNHIDDFSKMATAIPFDSTTHGITIKMMKDFKKIRKYANKKAGLAQGDEETFNRRMYLHIYFNSSRKIDEDRFFEQELLSIKAMLDSGIELEELSDAAKKKAEKYLIIKKRGNNKIITFNEKECLKKKKYHGFFALVSNNEKQATNALSKYRKREYVEDYFRAAKQTTDSMRVRVWNTDTLRGRMFVQFIALCYYEYLNEEIRKMKQTLGNTNGDKEHDSKDNIQLEQKLKSWLDNTPLYLQLQWFDTVEEVNVSSKLHTKRWTTEITARDKLYLQKLGISQ